MGRPTVPRHATPAIALVCTVAGGQIAAEPPSAPETRIAQAARQSPSRVPRQIGGQDSASGSSGTDQPGWVPEHEGRHHGPRRKRAGQLLIVTDRYYGYEERRRRLAPAEPEPDDPVAPPDQAEEPEVGPPDPGSPGSLARARGIAPSAIGFTVGGPLPPGLPHVTLDWRTYDLPRPPDGQIYARVGRTVLLIDATTREVIAPVGPAGGG